MNIRNLLKNFDHFKTFLSHLKFTFKVICLSEVWLDDAKYEAIFNLSNHQIINLYRKNGGARGGVCIFIHELIDFKERKHLSISKNDSEILSIKITTKTKNIILSSVYRPPDSSLKELKNSLKPVFDNIRRNNKDFYLVGYFNINVLEYENNVKVKNFIKFCVSKQSNTSK